MVNQLIDIRPHLRDLRPLTLKVVTESIREDYPNHPFYSDSIMQTKVYWVRCQDYRPSGGDATPMFTVFDHQNCDKAVAGIKNVTPTVDFFQLRGDCASIQHLSLFSQGIDGRNSGVINKSCACGRMIECPI
eukprot:GEMP01125103.1.p1 GENE.GEMP01125103.1~~GEMP01125103.1.p1  ORF type:complete len:139 (+),score=13.68 GEMP01125103.1:24-419(+)